MTPEFRTAVYAIPPEDARKKIPIELQRMFARLQLDNREAIATKELTDSFGWNEAQLAQQQDVAELNCILLDAIARSLKGATHEPTASLIDRLYRGWTVAVTECTECGYRSRRPEETFQFTVQTEGCQSLRQSLAQVRAAYF